MALIVPESSSSNSSNSNSTPKWKFHVFLSFRGEDTRKSFTDHLYAALRRKGLAAFRDDEELKRGEVISQNLLKAIEESLFAIVVISKNYASSSWCLDELQKIIASKNELGQQVFPIFYGVDPSDVRHQKGSFVKAFTRHEEKFREEKVRKWRDSLTEVANLSGWDSEDWHESELIEDVAQTLWGKLLSKLPYYNGALVGIDSRLDAIYALLGVESDDVRFVGIWGMGGIGKTTLASIVYERLLNHFEIHCFLPSVRELSEKYDSQFHLQSELLSRLKVKGIVIDNTYQGKNTIRNLFCHKKVLLVLDDVNSISQLENLVESQEWFGAGSRVIITTRDMHLLKSHGVNEIYEVGILKDKESLQLFCSKAFKRDQPQEGYLELSKLVVEYAGGLPLALKVLGSFLFERSIHEWEDALKKLKQVPNINIHKILKTSYDGLDDEEKAIFLDLACFFKGWKRDKVMQILTNCGLHPEVGIKVLIEKSLLNNSSHIDMHDLIVDVGKRIVFQESPNDASKRSRLWSMEDIDQVLRKNMGTKAIQGMASPKQNPYETHWALEAFSNMSNLRLLIISSNLYLPCGFKCLPDALKVLHWREYPLKTLPMGTQLDKLVELKMRYSKIRELFNEGQCLEYLKFLDLSHSKYLIETPDFSGLPNLERLTLKGCVNLAELHSSLGKHKNLVMLNLKGCINLKALPRKLRMTSLKEFILCGCTRVRNLPEFGETMEKVVTIDAGETGICKLPESLGLLTGLEALKLRGCKNLVCIPHDIHRLKHLKILEVSDCTKLFSCKGSTSNSWIASLPLNHMFQRHSFPKNLSLPASIFDLKSLTELDLSYCNIDDGFIPNDLSGLSSLRELHLTGNKFVNLPTDCISNLLKLELLFLNFCPRLQLLPQPSPELKLIEAEGCASMETLSDEELVHLFAVIHKRGQYAPGLRFIDADADLRASLSLETLSACIPGTEIPSWFDNQCYLYPHVTSANSIIIDIPPGEWLGIVLCVVLDDMFYSIEANPRKLEPAYWELDISRASDSAFASIGGVEYDVEKGINYPHLWILVTQIREKNGLELTKNYSQLRLKFEAWYNSFIWDPHRKEDGKGISLKFGAWYSFPCWDARRKEDGKEISVKCGWRVICNADFESHLSVLEEHNEGENGMWSEAKEQGQCSLSVIENSQTIISECKTKSSEASSPCSEEEGQLNDDSWMQFITDDARFWF